MLAKDLGLPFYDLDWYIESRMMKTVPQLFAERGEEGFRKVEHNMLHEVAEFEDVVISCGGGTPCFYDNMEYMNAQGDTVYLKASPEVLYAHLQMGKWSVRSSRTRPARRCRRLSKSSSPSAKSIIQRQGTYSMLTCLTITKNTDIRK